MTIANQQRDFPEWHRGRAEFMLWALDVDFGIVRRSLAEAQTSLAEWLLDDYRRQPHVTLGLCGFPTHTVQQADEFDLDMLAMQIQALQGLAPSPFEIEIGNLATFPSAPYLEVHAPAGSFQALRECLAGSLFDQAHADFVPHVTVGLYDGSWPMVDILQRINAASPIMTAHVQVESLCLMSYAARDINGPLTTLARYDFRHRTLNWRMHHPILNAMQ